MSKTIELLNAYNQSGELIKTQERKSLLKEIRDYSYKNGDANLAVETFYLILTNSKGDLYIVKRGGKPENPNRDDKTTGGHVIAGETPFTALQREAYEEIGVGVVLTDLFLFHQSLRYIDTTKLAVVRPIDYNPWMKSIRVVEDGEPWVKRHRTTIFTGVYDGPVEFVDGEAVGMQLISKDKLLDRMKESPHKFTYDLKILLDRYSVFF